MGTTATKVLNNNPDRLAWTLVNLDTVDEVFVAFDNEVSTSRGIKASAGGGSISLTVDEDGELVTREVVAIASPASASIFIVETEAT